MCLNFYQASSRSLSQSSFSAAPLEVVQSDSLDMDADPHFRNGRRSATIWIPIASSRWADLTTRRQHSFQQTLVGAKFNMDVEGGFFMPWDRRNVRSWPWIQPIDATLCGDRSAGFLSRPAWCRGSSRSKTSGFKCKKECISSSVRSGGCTLGKQHDAGDDETQKHERSGVAAQFQAAIGHRLVEKVAQYRS